MKNIIVYLLYKFYAILLPQPFQFSRELWSVAGQC